MADFHPTLTSAFRQLSVSFALSALYPRGKSPHGAYSVGAYVGYIAWIDTVEK